MNSLTLHPLLSVENATIFPVKPWTPQKISRMFIVSRPIRCKMRPQKIPAKPQHGLVTNWYETTSWLFFQRTGFSSTTNLEIQSYRIRNRPRSECKLWKFTMVQVFGRRLPTSPRMRRHHPGVSCMTRAWFETKSPIKRLNNKKNGLKMTNSAYILQACECNIFATKKLAYGFFRRDMDP